MKTILKLAACWVAFSASLVAAGTLAKFLPLQVNSADLARQMPVNLVMFLVASLLLVLGLYPIARGLAAPLIARISSLVFFVAMVLGLNTILEGVAFKALNRTIIPWMTLMTVVEALFLGAALGACFASSGEPTGLARHTGVGWAGCTLVAWLAWPLVYFVFGACIAPIVLPYYTHGVLGLHLPTLSTILSVQLVRSVIFLTASLPLMAQWRGSRLGLWFALGMAHAFTVGIYGMVAASSWPTALRITHGTEITCASFAYAGLLVLLFAAPALHTEAPVSMPVAVA